MTASQEEKGGGTGGRKGMEGRKLKTMKERIRRTGEKPKQTVVELSHMRTPPSSYGVAHCYSSHHSQDASLGHSTILKSICGML